LLLLNDETRGDSLSFAVFYNIYIPPKQQASMAPLDVIREQLNQVKDTAPTLQPFRLTTILITTSITKPLFPSVTIPFSNVKSAHTAALATSPSSTAAIPEIEGRAFPTGTHNFDVSISIAVGTTVTLHCEGDPNSKFVFRAGTTLTTGRTAMST
jgi:hypothetical protein